MCVCVCMRACVCGSSLSHKEKVAQHPSDSLQKLFGEYGRARAALPLSNYSYVSKTVQLYTSLSLIINYGSKTVCNKYIIITMLHV